MTPQEPIQFSSSIIDPQPGKLAEENPNPNQTAEKGLALNTSARTVSYAKKNGPQKVPRIGSVLRTILQCSTCIIAARSSLADECRTAF